MLIFLCVPEMTVHNCSARWQTICLVCEIGLDKRMSLPPPTNFSRGTQISSVRNNASKRNSVQMVGRVSSSSKFPWVFFPSRSLFLLTAIKNDFPPPVNNFSAPNKFWTCIHAAAAAAPRPALDNNSREVVEATVVVLVVVVVVLVVVKSIDDPAHARVVSRMSAVESAFNFVSFMRLSENTVT